MLRAHRRTSRPASSGHNRTQQVQTNRSNLVSRPTGAGPLTRSREVEHVVVRRLVSAEIVIHVEVTRVTAEFGDDYVCIRSDGLQSVAARAVGQRPHCSLPDSPVWVGGGELG